MGLFGALLGASTGGFLDSLIGNDELIDGVFMGGVAGYLLEDWNKSAGKEDLRSKVKLAYQKGEITRDTAVSILEKIDGI